MCGILLAVGDAFRADFDAALAMINERGPDAREVPAHGTAFTTCSDSEVLLTGYLHWGEAVVEKLDGINSSLVVHYMAQASSFSTTRPPQTFSVRFAEAGFDKLFGGYPRFLDTVGCPPDNAAKRVLRGLLRHGPAPASPAHAGGARTAALPARRARRLPRQPQGPAPLSGTQAGRCLETTSHTGVMARPGSRHGDYDRSALLHAGLWTYVSKNCLAKTDRTSMAHDLEVRVPLLANDLQDRILRLPARWSHCGSKPGRGKVTYV